VLARLYAEAALALLKQAGMSAAAIRACGRHGQTIRHRPDAGYTLQIGNPALLAELTGVSVVADFRSRDVAAGAAHRVIANIGGVANLTDLPAHGVVTGFDTDPGNVLLDLWIQRHLDKEYDQAGGWAQGGTVLAAPLAAMPAEPYFARLPPKSCGRDLLNAAWL
jgi:anhydro-N-acetylmuramic acid kinase